ncbi:MAG: glutamate--cysteine ligase [Gammaproteobacteria bacterium]
MFQLLQDRLEKLVAIDGHCLEGGARGIEKESLRVTPAGHMSRESHPTALGAALTHPWITTDYAECLLEFVTPPVDTCWEALQFLCDVHEFTYPRLPDDELLWSASMPCLVSGDDSVPVARYGDSNVGRMKHIYRLGLGYRYGRVMQTISGVHYNYSFSGRFWQALGEVEGEAGEDQAFRNRMYFALLRNFRRYGWLVLYLFGASPALCKTFLGGRDPGLPELDPWTRHGPHATSLRMSDLGYRNTNQATVHPSMNTLPEYVADLEQAMRTPYPPYERIGTVVDGQWRQLSANLLQIENEYYGHIRPKQPIFSGERPTHALRRGGVAYVEVRALDVSPFDPVGVSQNELRFIEALLAFCMLHESPSIDAGELEQLDDNHGRVAVAGRRPGLRLAISGVERSVAEWGREICDLLEPICSLLDGEDPARSYSASLEQQRAKFADPSLTPSARILDELSRENESFFAFAQRAAHRHREYFRALPPMSEAREAFFNRAVEESLARRDEMEAAAQPAFEQYLRDYLA